MLAACTQAPAERAYMFSDGMDYWYIDQMQENYPPGYEDPNPGDPVLGWEAAAGWPADPTGPGTLVLTLDLGGRPGGWIDGHWVPPVFDSTIIQCASSTRPGYDPLGDCTDYEGFACRIWLPADAPQGSGGTMCLMFAKTGPTWQWNQAWPVYLWTGWNIVMLDASFITGMDDVREVGVKIGGDTPWDGDVLVDLYCGYKTVTSAPGTLQAGWNLISLPRVPLNASPSLAQGSPKQSVPAVFDQAIAAGNVIENGLYAYTPSSGYMVYPTAFTQVTVGQGYWLYLISAVDEDLTGCELEEPLEVALGRGWNLLGASGDDPVPCSDLQFTDGATTLSFDEAAAQAWIQGLMYYYEGGSYSTCSTSGADDDSLRPWRGYWILVNVDGISAILPGN